jgi:hypothetical protein
MNKKAFIHTLEAVIAIVLLLGIIVILSPKQEIETGTPLKIVQAHNSIFNEIEINYTMRDCLLKIIITEGVFNASSETGINPTVSNSCITDSGIESLIESRKPKAYSFIAEICESSQSCLGSIVLPIDKSIYAESLMLTTSKKPKVIRIYFWER